MTTTYAQDVRAKLETDLTDTGNLRWADAERLALSTCRLVLFAAMPRQSAESEANRLSAAPY